MGMTRGAPWWLTWLLAGGLVLVFVGERILGTGTGRSIVSLVGAAIVIGATVWRAAAWSAAEGESRRIEGLLLLAYAGCLLGLAGYLVSSTDGMRWLGIELTDPRAASRYRTILRVAWPLLLAISLLPALAAQHALAAHRHGHRTLAGVEAFRVRETAAAGLTVALAGALLFVVGYIASEREKTLDLSYFRTSAPGLATRNIVGSLDEPLRVLLFFPGVNEVKDEVRRYFVQLGSQTGNVRIEEHDRLASPGLAEQFSVISDGTIVVAHGDRNERLEIGAEIDRARPQLRRLDRTVQTALLPLVRERRTVYMTTGHGELNDPRSAHFFGGIPLGQVDVLREILGFLNYDVQDLGVATGLGFDVPADAAMVMILGPSRPFLDSELAALERYLERGGSLLLALDPESEFALGGLEAKLGVRYVPVPLADDEQHVRQRGDLSDRRLLVTDRFLSHEVLTSVNRAGTGAGILLIGPGYLEAVEDTEVSPIFVVRSAPTTFGDVNRDFQYDEGDETRRTHELIAVVQGPAPGDESEEAGSASSSDRMRAMVFPSSAMLSDAVLSSLGLNAALVADGVRWLGGEEAFVGETESEEDIPIMHTRSEDVAWFYVTILGAPVLVLALGLAGVYRHRRRGRAE